MATATAGVIVWMVVLLMTRHMLRLPLSSEQNTLTLILVAVRSIKEA